MEIEIFGDDSLLSGGTKYITTLSGTSSSFENITSNIISSDIYSGLTGNAVFYGSGENLTNVREFIQNSITVGSGTTGDYQSIKTALDSITGNSATNRYNIIVYPGVYVEDTMTLKEYVDIKASSSNTSMIIVDSTNKNLFNLVGNSTIDGFILRGSSDAGKSIFNLYSDMGLSKTCTITRCSVGDTDMVLNSNLGAGEFGIVAFEGITSGYGIGFNRGFNITGDGFTLISIADTKDAVNNTMSDYIKIGGTNNRVILTNVGVLVQSALGASLTNFINCENGSTVQAISTSVDGCYTGVKNNNVGSGCDLLLHGFNIVNSTEDLNIQNSATTGTFFGNYDYTKVYVDGSSFNIVNRDLKIIQVSKDGGDFNSISSAVAYISDSSESNRYLVNVGAGEFFEPLIDLKSKPYVSIVGSSIQTTIVYPDNSNHHVFTIGDSNEISFLTISSAGSGYAGVAAIDSGDFMQLHKVSFVDCDTCVKVTSSTQDTVGYLEYVDFNGTMTHGLNIESTNGFNATINVENFYTFPSSSGFTAAYITGPDASLTLKTCGIYGNSSPNLPSIGNTGIECQNGSKLSSSATEISGFNTGIQNNNTGIGCVFNGGGIALTNNDSLDINIEHPSTSGFVNGSLTQSKVYINPSNTQISTVYSQPSGGFIVTGGFSLGETNTKISNITDLILKGSSLGLYGGGGITLNTGLTVNVGSGNGYVVGVDDYPKKVIWSGVTGLTIPSNSVRYVCVDENNTISLSSTQPPISSKITIGRVISDGTKIVSINNTPINAHHYTSDIERYRREVLSTTFKSGCIVTQNVTPRRLNVSNGVFYFSNNRITPSGGNVIPFTPVYKTATPGQWNYTTSADTIPNDKYDNGTGTLVNISAGKWVKHSLYVNGDGLDEKYFLLYGQTEFDSQVLAENGTSPTKPDGWNEGIAIISDIVIQQGATSATTITDKRDFLGTGASGGGGGGGVTVHGELTGLSSDDHTQYLLVNGAREMSGNLNLNNNQITNSGLINGVNITAHASRHLPNGSDPISTGGTPTTIGTSNSVGIANAYSRSDHGHDHGNQTNGSHHAVVTTSVNGFMSAADKVILDSNKLTEATGTTTNATQTTIQTISSIPTNSTTFVEVYVKAYQSSATNWGVWKRTLAITRVAGAPTIQFTNSDMDRSSSGLNANSLTFTVSGNDILVRVTGIAATTITWTSKYRFV